MKCNGNKIIFAVIILAMMAACQSHTVTSKNNSADSILHLPVIAALTDSIQLFPNNTAYYYARSNALFGINQFELSKKDLYKAIQLQPDSAKNYFAMGEVMMATDSPKIAQEYFQKAIALSPQNLNARLELANSLFQEKLDTAALKQVNKILQQYPQLAEAYGLQSQVYEDMRDTIKAINAMQRAVKLAPNNFDALMALAGLYHAQHNALALKWYSKAYQLDTTNAEALDSAASFYLQQGNNLQAEKMWQQSIIADRNNVNAYLQLGKIYLSEKNLSKAIEIFNLAENVAPANAQIYLQRGYAYQAAGNKAAAIADFNRAIMFDKNLAGAKDALKKMRDSDGR